MTEKDLFNKVLDLGDDWDTKDVVVDSIKNEVDIYIKYSKSTGLFPGTQSECKVYDFKNNRRFRHLDLF
jgi:hypothetical protein